MNSAGRGTWAASLAALAIALLACPATRAVSLRAKYRAIRAKIASIGREIVKARAKELSLSRKLRQYEERMERARERERRISRRIARVEREIEEIEAEISSSERRLEQYRRRLRRRLVSVYKAGPVSYVALILGAEDFGDLVGRCHLASRLMERDRRLCRAIKREIEAVAKKRKALEGKRRQLVALRRQVLREEAEIRRGRERQLALLERIRKERRLRLQALMELEETARRIERMLERRYRRHHRRSTPGRVAVLPERFPSFGPFLRPVRGRITSRFDYRRHPILGGRRFHTGVDIAAPGGTPIRAAREGVVIFAGWLGGYGKCVIIDHGDGYTTLYGHCSSICVSRGQHVSRGQVVGRVGSTGLSTGPHLHFEVRYRGRPVNPLRFR